VINKDKLKEVSDYEDWCFNTFSRNVWANQVKHT
jgi:hypothetical protein